MVMAGSCSMQDDGNMFVINELMASNKTGLLADDGATYDWIEIRNTSSHAASLSGYALAKDTTDEGWEFPDTTLQPNQCIVVYATKAELKRDLHCDFKLSKKSDTIYLMRNADVVNQVIYKKLKTDQALHLTDQGEYKKTYSQTPGFENTRKGREQYFAQMEQQRKSPLRIWEYLSKNPTPLPDDEKSYEWIELKNTSGKPVSLKEYALTDDMDNPRQMPLPDQMLAPGQTILIADKEKSLDGESIILTHNGRFADGICAGETYCGISIGRLAGRDGFVYFGRPTPGAENTTLSHSEIAKAPKFDTKPGQYKKDTLRVALKTHGLKVHYTLDNSVPTMESPVYEQPIPITQTTIVRAFAEDSTMLPSSIVTATYLLNENHTLPVVSITARHEDLFSPETGIYMPGPGADEDYPNYGANFWKPWERFAHIELLDGKEGFSVDCGIKIFGAFSRARDKKSFHIKLHKRYGDGHIKYDLFGNGEEDEYKSFVLRSGSQDDNGVMVRDEFFTTLMSQQSPTLHVQAYRPVVLYINAEYWGVYYIREKVNEEFVARHLGVKPESVSLLVGVGSAQRGTNSEYRQLEEYVRTHDMRSAEAYRYMQAHVDFNSLIDYKIAEFYTGNCDVGNIRFFKSSDKACNGKWHWLFYDLDWGFYYETPLRFYIREDCTRASGASLAPFNLIISRLLQNPDFRKQFRQRWQYHMQNTFSEKNAVALFDKMIADIKPEMERNCRRWPSMGYASWERNVQRFREKIVSRREFLQREVNQELGTE